MAGLVAGPPLPMVGRAAELDAVRALIADTVQGSGRVVLVDGEAGMGKSRLVSEALTTAAAAGFNILSGSCDDVGRDRPLRPLLDAFVPDRQVSGPTQFEPAALARLRAAGRTLPLVPAPVGGGSDEGWLLVETVVEVVEDLASAGPVALVVEDLHWADSTHAAGTALRRPLGEPPATRHLVDSPAGHAR